MRNDAKQTRGCKSRVVAWAAAWLGCFTLSTEAWADPASAVPRPGSAWNVNLPVRAASFTPSPGAARLVPVPHWPQLPKEIILERVSDVAVDSRGFVYVAHRGEHPLLCLNPDGSLRRMVGESVLHKSTAYDLRGPVVLPLEERHWVHGLFVDASDNVWLTDVGRNQVFKFDPAGALVMTLGTDRVPGEDDRHFYQPTHVAVAAAGEIFVTDGYGNSRVVKFSPEGKFLKAWGTPGLKPGEFHTPHSVVLDKAGILYVTDRENDRIQVFDGEGKLRAIWPGLHSVDGLCLGNDGLIYGSAGVDKCLIRFDLEGHVQDVRGGPDSFTYPHGIWVDRAGYVYVADVGAARILKFAPAPRP